MPKLCDFENCRNRAIYNEPNETKPIRCKDCKTETMIDVVSKKCKCGSGKYPSFNEPNETKPICCKKCKTETMIDHRSKKCKCGKPATFNEPNETKRICCKDCKTDTMICAVSKRCKESHCITIGNKKYKGYCTYCYQHLFPNDPLTFQIRSKTKEIAVRDFINSIFDGFIHDKPIYTNHCQCDIRRRIDHRKLINNTILAIETDENQHKSYNERDEEIRYHDLCNAFSGKWIYIRFNPDKYISKNSKRKNPEIATRLRILEKEIIKQIERINNEENKDLLEKIYLFYDNYT